MTGKKESLLLQNSTLTRTAFLEYSPSRRGAYNFFTFSQGKWQTAKIKTGSVKSKEVQNGELKKRKGVKILFHLQKISTLFQLS